MKRIKFVCCDCNQVINEGGRKNKVSDEKWPINFFTFWLKECGHVNGFVVCRGFLHSLVFLLDSNDSTLFYFSFFGRLCGRSGDGRHYIHVCGRTLSLL